MWVRGRCKADCPPRPVLLDAPPFSAVIVATNGTMALMSTMHPAAYVTFKRWLAGQY